MDKRWGEGRGEWKSWKVGKLLQESLEEDLIIIHNILNPASCHHPSSSHQALSNSIYISILIRW